MLECVCVGGWGLYTSFSDLQDLCVCLQCGGRSMINFGAGKMNMCNCSVELV